MRKLRNGCCQANDCAQKSEKRQKRQERAHKMTRGHLKTIERQSRKPGRTSMAGRLCLDRGIQEPECACMNNGRKLLREDRSKIALGACFSFAFDLTSKRGENGAIRDMRLRGIHD